MSNFAEHRQGCPALPGYGHAPEPCTCGAMTAETELLPLYAELQGHPKIEIIKHYARANVARATAPLQAEIEALRAEVERANSWNERVSVCRDHVADIVDGPCVICALDAAKARAERLAEALQSEIKVLRQIASFGNMSDEMTAGVADRLEALLHDQEEGHEQ